MYLSRAELGVYPEYPAVDTQIRFLAFCLTRLDSSALKVNQAS